MSPLARHAGLLLVAVGASASLGSAGERPCFDLAQGFDAPLRPPIDLHQGKDHSLFGTYPDGIAWASARAAIPMPLSKVFNKLRDPRNLKDMRKTKLVVRPQQYPGYLDVRELDVEVAVRAFLVKLTIRWTEQWAFRLVEGTPEEPLLIVANYQKIAGTAHIRHQCGSYVLRALGAEATDLSLYEEVRAKRRSAQDTRDMLLGNLQSIRENRWASERMNEDPRVQQRGSAVP